MKKILATLIVLALVAPAFAVSFTGTDLGLGKMRLSYNVPTGEVLRGVALNLNTTAGTATIASAAAVTAIDPKFNTFIDYAFSHAVGYTIGAGNPLALTTGAGELTTFPASTFVLSMGALDQAGAQAGVTGTGTLCEIQYNITANATIHVMADTIRGGAVVGDAVTQPTAFDVTLIGVVETITTPSVAKTTAAPAAANLVNGGRVETFVASGAVSSLGHALQYQFNFGDGSALVWGAATQTHTYTYTAAATYNVTVQARCAADTAVLSAVSAASVQTTEAVKSTAAGAGRPAGEAYAAWAQFSRPNCWAFKRNCRGDSNGLKSGLSNFIWVNSLDLAIFSAAYNKTTSDLLPVVVAGSPGICADNNRLRSGLSNFIWVNSADLTIFSAYYNKTETNTPVCDQTNYHYWTN